ncbi:hypothetical protein ACFPJ7_19875, partial [Brachybacterium fresconis]
KEPKWKCRADRQHPHALTPASGSLLDRNHRKAPRKPDRRIEAEYPGTGIEESPDCGHVYEQMSDDQPGGLYTLNITAHWAVDWDSNTGEGGQIPLDLTTDKQLRIGSYQSVVTDVT